METIKTSYSDGKLVVTMAGRIDMNNVEDVRKEVFAAVEAHPDVRPRFDAKELDYISSAGLRVLLQVGTRYDQPLDIVDVSPMVMEILETTGFTQIMNIQPAK